MKPLIIANRFQLSFIDYPSANKSALTYYVYGCGFHCPGCQNAKLQCRDRYDNDEVYIFETPENFLDFLVKNDQKSNRNQGLVVIQGGDPFFKDNREFILKTITLSVEKSTGLRFCIYTGFTVEALGVILHPSNLGFTPETENLSNKMNEVLSHIPYIKCGEYDQMKPNVKNGKIEGKLYLATTNQIIYKYNPEKLGYEPISKAGIADLAIVD